MFWLKSEMNKTYVIDASVAVKFCVEEEDSQLAKKLIGSSSVLIAPAHCLAEAGEVLARKVRSGMLPMPLATESLAMLAEILTFIDVETLVCNSVTLSLASGASVYDTLYIEAAKMVGCPMITSDSRLGSEDGRQG